MIIRYKFRLSTLLLAMGGFVPVISQAVGQNTTIVSSQALTHYQVKAGPVQDSLNSISRLSGYQITYSPGKMTGLTANPVSGNFAPEQAIVRAIDGLPLNIVQTGPHSFTVSSATALKDVLVVAKRDQAEESFKADRSDTATRSGTSLMETPASVTVVTSKVLESQQATSVQDALSNVSGVTFDSSPQGQPTLTIRGFADTSALVNGVSDSSAASTNVYDVERIEVLKGPQAILAGANSLGGGVNVVTKKPQAAPLHSVTVQYGTHNDRTVVGDFSGALTDNKKLSYRFIASKTAASRSDAGYDGRRDESVMPELRWKDEDTDFTVGYSYSKQFQPLEKYTFAYKGKILPAPAILMSNKSDGFDSEQQRYFYDWTQKINDHVTFISRFQHSHSTFGLHLYNSSGIYNDEGTTDFSPLRSAYDSKETSGDHYFRIEGDTGPISHKLSIGLNHNTYISQDHEYDDWDGNEYAAEYLDVPIYSASNFGLPAVDSVANNLNDFVYSKSTQIGVYAQDLMTWNRWNLLLNVRRSRYTTSDFSHYYYDGEDDASADAKQTTYDTTPGVGVIYDVTSQVSVYASYAEGFEPQFYQSCSGGMLPPQRSKNREVGAKFDLLNSNLSVTTAAFDLQRNNVLQYNNMGSCYNTLAGQETHGLEFDLQGQILPGWNAVANYTYSELSDKSNSSRIFTAQPKHKISLWTTYQIQNNRLRGLGFGAGINAASKTNGDPRERYAFKVPGYALVDLSTFYTTGPWTTTLGLKNIFNKQTYQASASNFVMIRQGRTAMLTVKYNF